MSFRFVALAREMTDTVPGPSLETRPVLPSRRIAAPYGWAPVFTYRTPRECVSTTAAASARLSGTSSVRPFGETARRSGQDCCPDFFGGKLCGT